MTYEYQCQRGHITEVFFKTISAGVEAGDYTKCTQCSLEAKRIISQTMPAHLLGNPDGYHNPSPTKRFTTKTVSQKTGNDSAIG